MIFKNTIRLVISNFSSVWKLLLYQAICFALTALTCGFALSPIIAKLAEANVFTSLLDVVRGAFTSTPVQTAEGISSVFSSAWEVLTTNVQFRGHYAFLIIWLCFVFPFLLDLSKLALGDVLYGYMASHVKYGFTGRFVKNIGKGALYSLISNLVYLVLNSCMIGFSILIIHLATLGNVWFLVLDAFLLGLTLCFFALKKTLFACWMPTIAVLDENVFKAFAYNFKSIGHRFGQIFSNTFLMTIIAWSLNLLFALLTMGVSLIITIPLTSFTFVVMKMVSFFTTQGMRYYVYPDLFVSPKTFEEQDKISKLKYIL